MTLYEKAIETSKNNKIIVGLLLLTGIIVGTAQFTGALKDLYELLPARPAYILDDEAYRRGEAEEGVGRNAAAAEAYRESASAGNPLAGAALAMMYSDGSGVPADREWATHWAEKALPDLKTLSDEGNADAQVRLGSLFQRGIGVQQDIARAVELYKEAAFQSHPTAQTNLAWMYESGQGIEQDNTEAVKWYRLAADQGYARAQTALGWMYESGEGVQQDNAKAVKWYRLAAQQGDPEGQTNLAWMYENGEGIAQDKAEAVRWFRRAADQGYARAQTALGCSYANGWGVPRDDAVAAKWYQLAEEQGNPVGQCNL